VEVNFLFEPHGHPQSLVVRGSWNNQYLVPGPGEYYIYKCFHLAHDNFLPLR
jgi:hypothetical protein